MPSLSLIEQTKLDHSYLVEVVQNHIAWREQAAHLFEAARAAHRISAPPAGPPPYFAPRRLEYLNSGSILGGTERTPRQEFGPREAIESFGDVVLIGEAGAGKTALLSELKFEYALAPQFRELARLPIYLNLANFAGGPFLEFIQAELRRAAEGDEGAASAPAQRQLALHIPNYIEEGRLILFVDGLDALARPVRAEGMSRLLALRQQYPRNCFVLAARSSRLTASFPVTHLALQDIELEARQELFTRFFPGSGRDTAASFFAAHPAFAPLRGNPFWLYLIGAVYELQQRLPPNRTWLLQEFTQALAAWTAGADFRRHAAAASELRALAQLALAIQKECGASSSIPRAFALRALAGIPRAGSEDEPERAERLLEFGKTAGLLMESLDGLVAFSHSLFQEYFAAAALQEAGPDSSLFRHVLRQPDAGEVMAFAAGLDSKSAVGVERLVPLDIVLAARGATYAGVTRRSVLEELANRLEEKMTSRFRTERQEAMQALAELLGVKALPYLLPRLKQAQPAERAVVEATLCRAPAEQLAAALEHLAVESDPWTRAWSAGMLCERRGDAAQSWLTRLADDPDWSVRARVARGLAGLGERAISQLVRLLYDRHRLVREAAAQALVPLHPGLVAPHLVRSPVRPWARSNREAEEVSTQEQLQALLPGLAALLRHNFKQVRFVAAEMLSAWQESDPMPLVLPLLMDPDPDIAWLATRVAARRRAQAAVPVLLALTRGSPYGKALAAEALGQILEQSAIPYLLPLLEDEDWYVRSAALRTLAERRASFAAPFMLPLLNDADSYIRRQAADVLSEVQAAAAIPDLTRALDDPEEQVRAAAARALGELGSRSAFAAIAAHLSDPSASVRRAAARALVQLDPGEASPLLARLRQDVDATVRRTAAGIGAESELADPDERAGQDGMERAIERLCGDNADARAEAERALRAEAGAEHLPLLEPLLDDPDDELANAAFEIIQAVRSRSPDAEG